jgi:hypothetical protein
MPASIYRPHIFVLPMKSLNGLYMGIIGLGAVTSASAQLTFTVVEFTTDVLTLQVNPGSLYYDSSIPVVSHGLWLTAPNVSSTGWINSYTSANSGPDFEGISFFSAETNVGQFGYGDAVSFVWNNPLNSVGPLTSAWTYTINSPGTFNPVFVSQFALHWGNPYYAPSTVQSIGLALTGATSSAVPEPSSYASLAGVAALGFCLLGRRRGRSGHREA